MKTPRPSKAPAAPAPAPAAGMIITPERVRRSLQSRYNPIANLTPAALTQWLDSFAQGYLGQFARLADAIERRDDKVAACKRKRCSAIARYGFEILTSDTGEDDALAATAEEHKRVLEYFYGNITAVNALDENQRGGFSLLVRQMADAIGKKYSVHEIIMLPGSGAEDGGLTAELRFAPLWFFENRTGRLRYLDEDGSTEGVEMPPDQWLVAVNDGIMEACAVAYMFKRLPLQDWLSFTEKFGMPGILGKTPAAHGTTEWTAMEDAVGAFMNDWAAVVNAGAEIALVEAKSSGGQLPFEPLIERMDRAIAILWRGADLSTMSAGAGQGQGASVQADEGDLLEQDDAAWISETLQMQLSRLVIRYHFGDVRPLAYIQIKTRDDGDTKLDIEVLKAARELGIPVAVKDARERLGLVTPDEGEELLGAKDGGGGMKDEEDALANDADFEAKHPRDEGGKFTEAGGGAWLHEAERDKDGKLVMKDGTEVPAHIAEMKLPPKWTNVVINKDPEGGLLAQGTDAKGRVQSVYSDKFSARTAAAKFARNSELRMKETKIVAQNEGNLRHADARVRENAAAMKLIHHTGIRPGSDTDTQAKVKAYGATTLEGRHVAVDGDKVSLQFTGKKGVALKIPVEDRDVAKMLVERKAAAGDGGKLFATDDAALREYAHTLNGGSFKPKDFRTLKGTNEALAKIRMLPKPTNPKEYKKAVKAVATHVAEKLGNTPTVALQSYINPTVFAEWRDAA